ncbi:MAG: hypothetical protein IKK51_03290 [Oscillospiraceae bacterium]|nr:hypothetical protein [Oscillospiraceae bacterium]
MKSNTDVTFWRELKASRPMLTKQQYRTIKGQAVKGNVIAARKGLLRIHQRRHG